MLPTPTSTLIATLGTEAQVITLALDCLLAKREVVSRVSVLHTLPPTGPILEAVERVRAEFSSNYYNNSIELQLIELRGSQGALLDVDSAEGADVTFQTIYRVLRQEKLAQRRVHFCLAGGRKTMSVFGMAAAQMLFAEEDRLWHLISFGELLKEKRMHTQDGDTVNLIPIPVILWQAVSPVFTDLSQIDDPFVAVEKQRSLQLKEQIEKGRVFVLGSLTETERRVVSPLVREGLSNAELGIRLFVSARTIEHHVAEIAAKATLSFELPTVSRTQLVAILSPFYTFVSQER